MYINVGVSIPSGSYHISSKSGGRKMAVHGWDLAQSESLASATFGGSRSLYHGPTWFENCEVLDANGELPDTLHIIVQCGREWEGSVGGSSWYATAAFVSRERAEEHVAKWESELSWFWIVQARRVSG